MLDQSIEAQIADLAARFGEPQRVVAELQGTPFSPISESDRIGEVCMVIRRKNGRFLTAIKTFYPPNAFRLLTGGIHHGEGIETALLREVWEETGLDVALRRFLAIIEYRLISPAFAGQAEPHFVTFAFLLDELGGTLAPQDPNEQLESFHEVDLTELPRLADTLAQVEDTYSDDIGGNWRDWGEFRAVVHRVVYDVVRCA